jgi:hypothetical protein
MVAIGCDLVGAFAGLGLEQQLGGVDQLGGHVLGEAVNDMVDELDVLVLAGRDARR